MSSFPLGFPRTTSRGPTLFRLHLALSRFVSPLARTLRLHSRQTSSVRIVIAWSVFHFSCSPFSFRSRARQPVLSFEAELLVCLSSTVFDPLELPRRFCVVCSRRDFTAHHRNSLVSMRPKSTTADLPTAYDVKIYIHNEFSKHMQQVKQDIIVSNGT